MSKTSQTVEVLQQLAGKSIHRKCFVLNAKRQLYVLDVVRWEPEHCQVVTALPNGRQSTPDPEDTWQVTVRTYEGAFAFEVTAINLQTDALTLKLAPQCTFAARRSKVRLQTESRNPVRVHFKLAEDQDPVSAELIDFIREGLGLDWSQNPKLEMGASIYQGQFRVCSEDVHFDRAEIVHAHDTQDGNQRIGIRFTRLTGKQASSIKSAFDACFLMQPYVSSTALDS